MNTFKKRLQSFLWRTGMMVLAVVVTYAMSEIKLLNLNPTITVIIGLILGEVSKFLNTETKL
jgi:hypothetical protein